MQKIELSNSDDIRAYQKAKKSQIWDSFNKASDDSRAAVLITKAELDEQFPSETHERYSLVSINSFREDIMKAEGIEDKEGAFKEASKGLKSFIVTENGKKAILFVRKKEKGE